MGGNQGSLTEESRALVRGLWYFFGTPNASGLLEQYMSGRMGGSRADVLEEIVTVAMLREQAGDDVVLASIQGDFLTRPQQESLDTFLPKYTTYLMSTVRPTAEELLEAPVRALRPKLYVG